MNVSLVLELLSQNACVLREDVSLMETGFVRCDAFGADVTREQTARLKGNLSRIEEIIDAFGDCGHSRLPE